jgi:hypothetical protein
MKKSLPHLSALVAIIACRVALAQTAPAPVAAPTPPAARLGTAEALARVPSGDDLLMRATSQLERRASVAARLRHQVAVNGQELYGIGSYWQQGSGEDLKVRLELQIAGQDAKLLQVSNSRFLWIDRQLPTGRTVTRFDLRQLRADPAVSPPDLDKLDPGKANWSSIQPLLTAHSGGLPSLLAALGENFNFLPPQTMRLAMESTDSAQQPTTVPVYAVVGQWKPEKLTALLTKSEEPTKDNSAPPPHKTKSPKGLVVPDRLPQEVLLLVGQADLFPYRIEYRQLETPTIGSPPRSGEGVIPYQLSVHPLVVLELSDVVFDAPIAAGQFDYTPGDADWVDQTAGLLERLKRQRQEQVATRSPEQPALPAR